MFLRRFLFSILVVFFSANIFDVNACSCGGQPSPGEALKDASDVLIGYVKKVENLVKSQTSEVPEITGEQKVWVRVDKQYKGAKKDEIVLLQPGHNCAPKYAVGEKRLLYAAFDRRTKTWEVYGCGRGGLLENVADDLKFLEALPDSAQRTRISGEISHYETTPQKGFHRVKNFSDIKVNILGEKKNWVIYTDDQGVYELYDLAPGKYKIQPEFPEGFKVRFPMPFGRVLDGDYHKIEVEVTAKSCVGADFLLKADNEISGKVFGTDGRIMPKLYLDLISAEVPEEHASRNYFRVYGYTNDEGSYTLNDIPAGKYLIVINKENTPSDPYPRVYYPGVLEKEKATIITLSIGDKRTNYDIHIPEICEMVTIGGTLLYSDGVPVSNGNITYDVVEKNGAMKNAGTASSAGDGQFAISVPKGTIGKLKAYIHVTVKTFPKCEQVEELIKRSGKFIVAVESSEVNLEPLFDSKGYVLVLPFSSCKEK